MNNCSTPLVASLMCVGSVVMFVKWWFSRKSPKVQLHACYAGYLTPQVGVEPMILETLMLIKGIPRDVNFHFDCTKIECCEISYKGNEASTLMECFIMLKKQFNIALYDNTSIVSEKWINRTLFNKLIPATKKWRWGLHECPNWRRFMPLTGYDLDKIYETSYANQIYSKEFYFFYTNNDQIILKIFHCIQKISDALGDNAYFHGPQAGYVDSIVFGTLAILYFTPGAPFRSVIESYPNLDNYLKTIKENVWPKWNHHCVYRRYNPEAEADEEAANLL